MPATVMFMNEKNMHHHLKNKLQIAALYLLAPLYSATSVGQNKVLKFILHKDMHFSNHNIFNYLSSEQ